MMALSKCVLDRVSERKNELKGRMYGLVEIMSRSVFARMKKRTNAYKDLHDQLVEKVFNKFTHELNEAWRDGCAHGRDLESSLNQHSNMDEEYGLDSEIDDDSLSISTFESQTSSSEQSLDDDADYDGEEYYSIMAPMDGVDQCVLDRVEERKNYFKDRAYRLMEIISRTVFARMEKRTSLYKDLLDQLVEQVFNKFTQELNDAWRDGCDYGRDDWNVYSDFDDLFEDQPEINYLDSIELLSSQQQSSPLHSNEDSSLHSSQTPSQSSSQLQHQNIIEDDEHVSDLAPLTCSDQASFTQFQSSSQQSNLECNLDEVVDDGEFSEDNWDDEVESIVRPALKIIDKEVEESEEVMGNDQNEEQDRDTQITGNESNLSEVNGQMSSDMIEDDQQIENYEELSVNVLSGMTNSASVLTTTIEMSEDYDDQDEIASQCNEDSSLHSSPTQSQPSSQSQHENIIQLVSDSGVMSDSVPISSSPSKALSPQQSLQECKLYKEVHDGEYTENNCDADVMGSMCNDDQDKEQSEEYDPDDQISANDEDLSLVNGQVDGDGENDKVGEEYDGDDGAEVDEIDKDDQHGVDQLNVLEHRNNNIDDTDEIADQLGQYISTGNEILFKSPTSKHVCEFCGKGFKGRYSLTLHTRTHTGDRPYKCPKCPKAFTQSAHMKDHIKSRHDKLKHLCTHCDRAFQSQLKLENHIRLHTIGHKLFVCTWENCRNAFTRKQNLNYHMCSHTRENPHKCPWKDKSQTDKHVCEPCHISFSTRSDLNRHTRKYTVRKLIKCPWPNCYKAFAQKADLQVHLESHSEQYKPEKKEELDNDLHVEENERSGKGSRGNDLDNEQQMDEDEDDENVENNDELTGQVGDDDDSGHGIDQLNGLEHRNNIDVTDVIVDQSEQNISTGNEIVPNKSSTGKHVCKLCGKRFKRGYNLAVHTRTHTGNQTSYKCPKCVQTFNYNRNIKQHLKSQHDKLKHLCTHCDRAFQSQYKLENHIRLHTIGHKLFVCTWENCRNAFTRKKHLNDHMCSHTRKNPHKCPWKDCTKVYNYNGNWNKHFKNHIDKIPFECPWEDCHEEFVRLKHFRVHAEYHTGNRPVKGLRSEEVEGESDERRIMNNHVQGDESSFENTLPIGNEEALFLVNEELDENNGDIEMVNEIEPRENNLHPNMPNVHQLVISINKCSQTVELRPCPFAWSGCTKTFTTDEDELQKHLKLIHAHHLGPVHFDQSLVKCPRENCHQTFAQNADLQQHLESHTGHGAQLLNANEGQFVLLAPSSQVVVVTDNPTAGEHVCVHCGKVSRTASDLAAHIRTHTGQKLFKCPWSDCQRAFANTSNLNYHLKFHNNDFPYVCTHCPSKFRISTELERHTRTHTGERPFRCAFDNCNMTFFQKAHMKQHHMIHTQQFPHVCGHCHRSFRASGALKVHIRKHTREMQFKCTWQNCAMRFISDKLLKRHYRTHGSTSVHSIPSVPSDK